MPVETDGRIYSIPQRYDRALRTIRASLAEADLAIVAELDVSDLPHRYSGRPAARCTILLVDSALLSFEASALDRAGAVFLPLHVLVSGDNQATEVFVANPGEAFHLRLPPGASDPLERLQARVMMAVESAERPAGSNREEYSE